MYVTLPNRIIIHKSSLDMYAKFVAPCTHVLVTLK